jgi:hypothetical protein
VQSRRASGHGAKVRVERLSVNGILGHEVRLGRFVE